jgi:hypothetical protein
VLVEASAQGWQRVVHAGEDNHPGTGEGRLCDAPLKVPMLFSPGARLDPRPKV